MMEPKDCEHLYGIIELQFESWIYVEDDNYVNAVNSDGGIFEQFTYCPYCRTQLHTIDGIPLGIPSEEEDDCIKGGCND